MSRAQIILSLIYENKGMTAPEIVAWADTLVVPKRKPRDISKIEHGIMVSLKTAVQNYKDNVESLLGSNIKFHHKLITRNFEMLRLPLEKYSAVYKRNSRQPDVVKGKYAKYSKKDVGSYSRFENNIKAIESFLSTLKGFHKAVLKNLRIEFVSASDMKTTAKYLSGKDIVWINPLSKKMGKTKDDYGSLLYILLHELGHRYHAMNPQSWRISDPSMVTTPYSRGLNSMNPEGETFAELFALSHWEKKYPKYSNQIKKFKQQLT